VRPLSSEVALGPSLLPCLIVIMMWTSMCSMACGPYIEHCDARQKRFDRF
jgi:hypothetical protein